MGNNQQFIDLERGFWDAAGKLDGDQYYEMNFDDGGVLILPFDGGMMNKKTVLPTIPKSDSWRQYDFSNVKVLPIDDNSVALYYEVRASHGDDQYHAYVGSVYVRRNGETWRLLLHQQTSI